MARYKKIRYRRLPKSNYHVQRRLVQAQEWRQSTVDPQNWLSSAVIFGVDSDDPAGTDHGAGIRTVKHITVDLVKRPFFKFATGVPNAFNYVYPAVVWAVVYVPEGTEPSMLFQGFNNTNMILYEPNQFVLGAGCIPDAGYDFVNEAQAGNEANFNTRVSAGNMTRLRVPLSRKMNPGDRLFLVMATTGMAYDGSPVGGSGSNQYLVKYAIKYN